ncbi:hypothetical protein ABK046_13405 [Streptomyces caeruleatus]
MREPGFRSHAIDDGAVPRNEGTDAGTHRGLRFHDRPAGGPDPPAGRRRHRRFLPGLRPQDDPPRARPADRADLAGPGTTLFSGDGLVRRAGTSAGAGPRSRHAVGGRLGSGCTRRRDGEPTAQAHATARARLL